MKKVFSVAIFVTSLLFAECSARSWTDIDLYHGEDSKDLSGILYLSSVDRYYKNTVEPTYAPTTLTPTADPTSSARPSILPSASPSSAPSSAPTPDIFAPNDPPDNPDPWYFNYDTRKEAKYGPGYPEIVHTGRNTGFAMGYKNNQWATVQDRPYPFNTWLEFSDNGYGTWKGALGNRNPLANQCTRIGRQSPIDLHESEATCEEHHEVRSRVSLCLHMRVKILRRY